MSSEEQMVALFVLMLDIWQKTADVTAEIADVWRPEPTVAVRVCYITLHHRLQHV